MQISLTDWKSTGQYLTYCGHQIFTRTEGNPSAPVLLLIHGFPTASWDWEALWPTLIQQYRVLTLDMIGFGFSAKPTNHDYTLTYQADLFEYLLKQHNVEEYHILAHDYGVSVAQELLARQNDPSQHPKLLSICFLNGGLFPESHRPHLIQKLLLSRLGFLFAQLNNRKSFASNMQRVFGQQTQPDQVLIDNFWQLLSENHGKRVLPKLMTYIPQRKQNRARWVGALQQSSIPIKLIDGMADPVSGAHLVKRYKMLISNPNVTELDDIGHLPTSRSTTSCIRRIPNF